MAMVTHLDIVTAERMIFSGPVLMVIAPALMGDVGITPRHTPLLTPLRAGEVELEGPEGDRQSFFVSGGILEVQPHTITILADSAMAPDEIVEAEARQARRRAEQALKIQLDQTEMATAYAELYRALAQLHILEKSRRGRRHRPHREVPAEPAPAPPEDPS
jgi:F-type H+-transporting ATPase subunit epsilon